jgi:glycosyltransferase involved in cell wall biosynthesis
MPVIRRLILISIILSTHNQDKYISEAIKSILAQTYKDFELIVINDASADNTQKIIDEYHELEGEIIQRYKTDDIGLSKTRNFGVNNSMGDYILFMDGDDKIHPEFLKYTWNIASKSNIGFVYTDTQHFDGANTYWEQPEYNFHNLLEQNFICSCSLINRRAFNDVGGFDEKNFGYWEDWEFWIALGAKGWYGKHIPKKLFYYRLHEKSGMQSERNKKLGLIYRFYIINKFPQLYPPAWNAQAEEVLAHYPADFMTWKPYQHEQWIKDHNL